MADNNGGAAGAAGSGEEGNYTGKKTVTFNINPRKTSIKKLKKGKKSVKITWNKNNLTGTGYQICYSMSITFENNKIINVPSNKTSSKTIKKLKAKKNYYFKIRTYKYIGNQCFYSQWSAIKKIKTK